MTAILKLHSNPMIYSPGVFRYIEETMIPFKQHKGSARMMLAALGIPKQFIAPILARQFAKSLEGDTLVLTIEEVA
jgi:hypothetical protein